MINEAYSRFGEWLKKQPFWIQDAAWRLYNKDNIRRYLMEGGRVIPGASTIHFDEISRKRIFAAIDNANFSDIRLIRENYTNLKNKDDKISKEFYYLGHMQASGQVKEFIMPNTEKTAVEIEWLLDVPVREDIYEYIVSV